MRFKIKTISFFIILTILCLVYSLIPLNAYADLKTLSIVSSTMAIVSALFLFFRKNKFSGGLLFYLCLLLMHFGQIFLIAMGGEFTSALKTSIAISENIPFSMETIKITTIGCLIISITTFAFEKVAENNKDYINQEECNYKLSSIGWTFVFAVLCLSVVSDLTRAIQVLRVGYGAGYHQTNMLLYYGDLLYPLALFLTISTYKNKSSILTWCFVITVIRSVFSMLIIGSRGEAVLDIIFCFYSICIFAKSDSYKKKIKKVVIVSALIAVFLLPFSGAIRGNKTISFSTFMSEYNPIFWSLTEFGGSIVNVRFAYEQQLSLYTGDFFASFLTIFPFSTFLFSNLIPEYGNAYASFLNNSVYGGGLGGSIIGESVFWFGSNGGYLIYLIIFTAILMLLLNKINDVSYKHSYVIDAPLLFLAYQMFYQIRGSVSSFQTGIKIMIYFIIAFYLIKNYLFKRETKRVRCLDN